MIPRRTQVNENYGHGLRDRVTACRKRLRYSRVAQRSTSSHFQVEVLVPETAPPVSLGYDLVAATLTLESEPLQLVEQEVGIT